MANNTPSKKNMKFQSVEALNSVINVINEASAGLNDKSRKIENSPISEALLGASGAAAGAGIGFAGLYLGGSVVGLSAAGITSGLAAAGSLVGGGMLAGIGVLAAPAVLLGGIGVGFASHLKKRKLIETKEIVYKEALAKQNAVLMALKAESNADKERIEYLNSLNTLLQAAIKDLRYDLGYAA